MPLEFIVFSPVGLVGFGIFIFSFMFMALAQVRHAIWDKGFMMDPIKNNISILFDNNYFRNLDFLHIINECLGDKKCRKTLYIINYTSMLVMGLL